MCVVTATTGVPGAEAESARYFALYRRLRRDHENTRCAVTKASHATDLLGVVLRCAFRRRTGKKHRKDAVK
jgi:hypothetical protein